MRASASYEAVISRWVRSLSTRRPALPYWVASSLAFSSETPESADSAAAIRARTSRRATHQGHSAHDGIFERLARRSQLCWQTL